MFPRTTSSRPFLFQSLLSPSPRVRLSVPSHPSGPCGVLRDLGDGQGLWEKVSAKFGPMCRERRGQARSARGQARAEMEGGHCWEPVHGERSTEPEVAPHATGLKRTSCKTGVWEKAQTMPKPVLNETCRETQLVHPMESGTPPRSVLRTNRKQTWSSEGSPWHPLPAGIRFLAHLMTCCCPKAERHSILSPGSRSFSTPPWTAPVARPGKSAQAPCVVLRWSRSLPNDPMGS